jgi:purine operon repressor
LNDIICNPEIARKAGKILALQFVEESPDYVITVETKGIPIAMMTADALNIPLIIVRRNNKVTEGSTVSINYLTGSSKRIQTMSLSKRSVKKSSKCIFIDDFMKAGGTANGIIELMKEFESEVVGTGVLIEALSFGEKLVGNYVSLMELVSVDEPKGKIEINPTDIFLKK